jgi:hypothetical protein
MTRQAGRWWRLWRALSTTTAPGVRQPSSLTAAALVIDRSQGACRRPRPCGGRIGEHEA